MADLFHDFPDLYQALSAIGAEQREHIGDDDVLARLTPEFTEKVRSDLYRLLNGATHPDVALSEMFADIAQWPETNTTLLCERAERFCRYIG